MCVCVCVVLAEHTNHQGVFFIILKRKKKRSIGALCAYFIIFTLFILLFFLVAALFFFFSLSLCVCVCTDVCLYSQVLLTSPFLIDVIEHPQGGERLTWTVWEASVSISGIISPSTLTKLCRLCDFQKRKKNKKNPHTPTCVRKPEPIGACCYPPPLSPLSSFEGWWFFLGFISVLFLGLH